MLEQKKQIPEKSNQKEPKVRNIGLLLTLLVAVILIPVGIKFHQSYNAKKTLYQERIKEEETLRKDVDKVKQRTDEMKEQEKFLKTNQGVEKVARDKLGLTKEDEIPLIIKKGGKASIDETTPVTRDKDKKEKKKTEKNNEKANIPKTGHH